MNIRLSGVRGPPFKLPIFTNFENFLDFSAFSLKPLIGTYDIYIYLESAHEGGRLGINYFKNHDLTYYLI